jgi:hypothetical protein
MPNQGVYVGETGEAGADLPRYCTGHYHAPFAIASWRLAGNDARSQWMLAAGLAVSAQPMGNKSW